MVTQTDLNEKRKDKHGLSILKVVKKLVPIDPTLLIIRAALGTILLFLVLIAHELAGVGGMVLVCILFVVGVSAPFWLKQVKKLYAYSRRIYTDRIFLKGQKVKPFGRSRQIFQKRR